jgi:hypothetical protein
MGCATRWALGQRHPLGAPPVRRGPCCTPDKLLSHSTSRPSDLRTDDADTNQWTTRPSTLGAYRWCEPTDMRSGVGLGRLELTRRWTGQLGLRHPPAPARACSQPAILGSGSGRGGRSDGCDAGQPGMERPEWAKGLDYGGPSQDGPGPRCCGHHGTATLLTATIYSPVGSLRRFTSTLCKGLGGVNGSSKVVYDEVPNPCYNECSCYISPSLRL